MDTMKMTNKYVTGVLEEKRENESEAIIKLTNYFLKGNMESGRQWGIIIVKMLKKTTACLHSYIQQKSSS